MGIITFLLQLKQTKKLEDMDMQNQVGSGK